MPSEFVFEPRSPRYGPFLVSGCWCTLRRFWGFLAAFLAVSKTDPGPFGVLKQVFLARFEPVLTEFSPSTPCMHHFVPLARTLELCGGAT